MDCCFEQTNAQAEHVCAFDLLSSALRYYRRGATIALRLHTRRLYASPYRRTLRVAQRADSARERWRRSGVRGVWSVLSKGCDNKKLFTRAAPTLERVRFKDGIDNRCANVNGDLLLKPLSLHLGNELVDAFEDEKLIR